MSPFRIIWRIILLVIITIVFSFSFYIFYTNSKAAGSPLQDDEYLQELNTLSERYEIVSPVLVTPTDSPKPTKPSVMENVSLSLLEFLSNLLK